MTEAEARRHAVQFWLAKAREALASARSELSADRTDFALNRCYYAVFYAASAVLLSRGHQFTKHSGVRAAVHRHLLKAGLLELTYGRLYDRLFEDRQQADYLAVVSFDRGEVAELLPTVTELVTRLESLVVDADARNGA